MLYRTLSQAEISDIRSRILYEDNHILIFNKAPGQIVQGDKTGDEPLSEALKAFIAWRDNKPGQVFMGVPHRLDRPVSGAVVFAKTSKALSRMAELFRTGKVHKRYWALCCSCPSPEQGELRNYLVRNEKANKSFIVDFPREGAKEARLRYSVIIHGDRYHLVEVELLTGRHHQIRCQLSGAGCPIKGDLKYGAPRSNPDGGICLHERRISFEHPVSHALIDVTAPLPPTFPGFAASASSDTTTTESRPS